MSDRDPEWLNDYLMQVGHAFNMAAELPGWLASGEFASPRFFHPWHALGEDWLLNARLLAGFFLDGGRETDVRPRDFLAGDPWRLDDDEFRDAAIRSRLTAFATGPNKHTMHFDAEFRGGTPLWSPTAEEHAEILSLLFDLGDRFASLLAEPHRSTMTGYMTTARSLRSWPPPLVHSDWSALATTTLRIGPPTAPSSLLFREASLPDDDSLTLVLVTMSGSGLTATAWFESLDGDEGFAIPEPAPADRSASTVYDSQRLSAYLIERGRASRPWAGVIGWRSLAGELTFGASCDATGHVDLTATLTSIPWQPTWTTTVTVTYPLADLEALGHEVRAWFDEQLAR